MDQKLRDLAAKASAVNDQTVAAAWEAIKQCYRQVPRQMEYLRHCLVTEALQDVPAPGGPVAAYHMMRQSLLVVATALLQEKVMEWLEAGEIPQGKAE